MERFEAFTTWFDSVIWTKYLFFLLLGCGLLFSILTKCVQWRALTHGLAVIRGKYDRPGDKGNISHFQALCAALSATIGLGNITGVGLAVTLGGPGAVFWMWVVGLFGMAIKFVECSLATMFRDVRDEPDPGETSERIRDSQKHTVGKGEVRGGPMWYIQKALVDPLKRQQHPAWVIFKAMAVIYAIVITVASFGGGNIFQAWSVGDTLASEGINSSYTGAVIAFLVSLVIIGGIKRIGSVAGKLVPFMCVTYVIAAFAVIFYHAEDVGAMFVLIFKNAFNQTPVQGAFTGVGAYVAFSFGLKRALFSNEAGQGSAAIAHSAARTEEPIREGVVAAMGPFIDTIIICTMTALVVLCTGTWNRPAVGTISAIDGNVATVTMTPEDQVRPRLRKAHYAELGNKHSGLWIYVEMPNPDGAAAAAAVGATMEIERLRVDTAFFAGKSVDEIKAIPSFTFELPKPDDNDVAAGQRDAIPHVAVGQAVHLRLDGAQITRFAMDTLALGAGRIIILIAVCLFAFSTMISWSYYGEKGVEYLFGSAAILPYKILFVIVIYFGCTVKEFKPLVDFSDAMTGFTVFCNLPACLILLPVLLRAAKHYFGRLDRGEMKRTR